MNDTRTSYWAKNEMLTKINDDDDDKKWGFEQKVGWIMILQCWCDLKMLLAF